MLSVGDSGIPQEYHYLTTRNGIQVKIHSTIDFHEYRVACLATIIANELGLPADQTNELCYYALFHDIGKVAIPSRILDKPARLTDSEFYIMKTHPDVGAELLGNDPGTIIVRQHLERWDGAGYPAGIKGNEIDYSARVLSIADSFDAMTEYRTYDPPRSACDALREIERCSGTQFDPEIAECFIRIADHYSERVDRVRTIH